MATTEQRLRVLCDMAQEVWADAEGTADEVRARLVFAMLGMRPGEMTTTTENKGSTLLFRNWAARLDGACKGYVCIECGRDLFGDVLVNHDPFNWHTD
jgi:hypothetical protein